MKALEIFQFIAGISVFLFGMNLLEQSLKELAGRPFKKFLQRSTSNPFKALFAGALVTAILQSSTIVSLLVLSFVGAGILGMRGAIALIMGSNIGTTLTGWLVAFIGFELQIESLTYPILTFAVIGIIFSKNNYLRNISHFLVGFSLLFIGLDWMKISAGHLITTLDLATFQDLPLPVFILIGFILTSLVQSSAAVVAITLTALYNRIIPFDSAAAIVIGSELGTSMKYLIATIGGIPEKKRVAWGNFMLNILTIVLAYVFLYPLIRFIQEVIGVKNPLFQLTTFQSLINLFTVLVILPFLNPIARWLERRFHKSDRPLTHHISSVQKGTPIDESLQIARKETSQMLQHAINLVRNAFRIEVTHRQEMTFWTRIRQLFRGKNSFLSDYDEIKILNGEILEFLGIAPDNHLSEQIHSHDIFNACRETLHACKNIKDIHHNLQELEESANDELHYFYLELKKWQEDFLIQLDILLQSPAEINILKRIEQLEIENKNFYLDSDEKIVSRLQQGIFKELEATSLLNVQRQIYSANKALLKACNLIYLLENRDEMNT